MRAPSYTIDDMAAALAALMPVGAAWPKAPGTVQGQAIRGLAGAFARSAGRAGDLLIDAFPSTAVELLPEWEATLDLPGKCGVDGGGTLLARQHAVAIALSDRGGQTIDYFTYVASVLGYAVTVTEFTTASVVSSVASPMTGPDWAHVWQVNGASYAVEQFSVVGGVNEALASWDNFVLGCVLNRIKPAHTTVIFNAT